MHRVFKENPLDEMLPYWGQDFDWSYRVKQNGWKLTACSEMVLGHSYIRESEPNKITEQRKKLRFQTDAGTHKRLIEKYGQDWRKII